MRALVVGVRAALCAALAGPALAHDSAHGQGYVNVFEIVGTLGADGQPVK